MTDDEVKTNAVFLRGRLAAEPDLKELPSGDAMVVFRLNVDRPPGGRVRVDSLECTSTSTRVRRSLERATVGDVLDVTGSLRRRFWRGAGGLGSRYAVEVDTARISRRPGPRQSATGTG